ncbi:MAG TPA: hypothetical protein VFP63_02390, partial [Dehalococcoidia bacterium]|nr:hypothetical protein [Dehalococcoidia bacterium]
MRLHSVRRLMPALLGVLVALLAAVLFYPDSGQAAPILATDKADYYAAETVTVTGTGFAPNTTYDIPIIRPDGSLVKGDGTLTPGWDSITSDASGDFTYLYKLDGIFGSYEVRAYQSSWSGNLSEGPITTVTFTDADIHFSQCSNDDNNDDVLQACKWVEGGLNQNNSVYTEGQSIPQRLFHKLTAAGAYQFEFDYDFSKSNIYAYDYLTSADQGPQATLALLNPCADAPAFASVCSPTTNSLYTGASIVPIASDSFDSVPGAEAAVATRNFRVACSGPGTCSAMAVFFPSGNGGDDPGENHVPDIDPADCFNATATKCGNMSVKIRVSVTTPAGTSNTSPTLVAMWFGGHLSAQSYWGTTGCGTGGTSNCGSSSISGAPFHIDYSCLDEPDSPDSGCASVGSRSNQASPGAVTIGSFSITKDVVTLSGTHPQDFDFTCPPLSGSFTLDDDGAISNPFDSVKAVNGIPATTYTCTEAAPPAGWALTAIACTDPDGGTTWNLATRTAVIDLDNGETVSCTFTNTATGTINIIKDAVPNDAQDFGFTCTGGLGGFSL